MSQTSPCTSLHTSAPISRPSSASRARAGWQMRPPALFSSRNTAMRTRCAASRVFPTCGCSGIFPKREREGWSPTVRRPKLGGNKRVGVFATRSPFRPNAIGLSSVRLDRAELQTPEGPVLHVLGADLMDGTPNLDIKPYLAYTDAHRMRPAVLPIRRCSAHCPWTARPRFLPACPKTGGSAAGCSRTGSAPGLPK